MSKFDREISGSNLLVDRDGFRAKRGDCYELQCLNELSLVLGCVTLARWSKSVSEYNK